MLFNSWEFLVYFLPIVFAGFCIISAIGSERWNTYWLAAASLLFYGWWNVYNLPLFACSMIFNYHVGRRLAAAPDRGLLIGGVAANIAVLGFFKYTPFAVDTVNAVAGTGWTVPALVLPLAISFFTFQQIAYLSDAFDGEIGDHGFAKYCLFITFFPHLIAGPITHHREMLPQFDDPAAFRPRLDTISLGATLFLLGLFKKIVFADAIGEHARVVFSGAAQGVHWTLIDAWGGAVAYALQIYFDFSGYTDMAIGLGLLFGIRLPQNFDSPYKARNIVEFWSRWHMTLTRLLTAYIYNPVVTHLARRRVRRGKAVQLRKAMSLPVFLVLVACPTGLTMLISGLWHGAGWQFVIFGLLHGAYITIVRGWQALKAGWGWWNAKPGPLVTAASVLLTFVCVVVALVFFRADSVHSALALLEGMAGLNGFAVHDTVLDLPGLGPLLRLADVPPRDTVYFGAKQVLPILALLGIVWILPNTGQWLRRFETALGPGARASWMERWSSLAQWRPSPVFGALVGAAGLLALIRCFSRAPAEFLYFQF